MNHLSERDKDISTVRHEPWRLTEWDRIAKEYVEEYAGGSLCGTWAG